MNKMLTTLLFLFISSITFQSCPGENEQDIKNLVRSCEIGLDKDSCFLLGKYYFHEKDNKAKGRIYLDKGCSLGDSESCELLANLFYKEGQWRDAEEYLLLMCNKYGVGEYCYKLYQSKNSSEVSEKNKLLLLSCKYKFGEACFDIGLSVLNEINQRNNGSTEDILSAIEYFSKGCKNGFEKSCEGVSITKEWYELLITSRKKINELRRKCENRKEECREYGEWVLSQEIDQKQYEDEAIPLLKIACENGEASSCKLLGDLFDISKENLSTDKSLYYYNSACINGDNEACLIHSFKIANNYSFDLEKKKNAIKYIADECSKNNNCFYYGMYELYRDSNKAIKILNRICNKNIEAASCGALGNLYESKGSRKESVKYYKKACFDKINGSIYCEELLRITKNSIKDTELIELVCNEKPDTKGCILLSKLNFKRAGNYSSIVKRLKSYWVFVIIVLIFIVTVALGIKLYRLKGYVESRDKDAIEAELEEISKNIDNS